MTKILKEEKITKSINYKKLMTDLIEYDKKHPVKIYFRNLKYRICNFIEDIPFYIKRFYQRGKRGWAESDTWNFDYYLSKVISEGVKHLQKTVHGCPTNLTFKEWKQILSKISYTFEITKKVSNGEREYIDNKRMREKLRKIYKNDKNVNVITEKEILRYKEGWKLFQKYYCNLWD